MLTPDLSQKFQEVLAVYLEAKEKGETIDPRALLRAHPELATELKEFFANEQQFAAVAGLETAAHPVPRKSAKKLKTGTSVGDYELLGEIARGGMGVVHRARHISLQRLVALKMLLAGEFAGPDGLKRFRSEAEIVARLDHPHIVPIFDIGEHESQAFFCMKLIDGPSLKQQMDFFAGKPELAVRLIIQIARAVHHAHQRGVLHRDIKPGNILLELVAQPKNTRKKTTLPFFPYVTDFGLAKRFQSGGKASHSTAIVGTAAYMPPEQATGRQALTVTADVYSLGAVLYELLAGRPPFIGNNLLEILLQVAEKDAPSPLVFQPRLDSDLARICLKCLGKNPDERYPSAEALAVELEDWLEGEPLTVRAPTVFERLGHLGRRHPYKVVSTLLIFLLVLTIVSGSIWMNWHLNSLNTALNDANEQLVQAKDAASDQRLIAEREAKAAHEALQREKQTRIEREKEAAEAASAREAKQKTLQESRRLLVQHYVGNGQLLLQRNDLYGAAIWFAEALKQDQGVPEREELHRIRLGTTLRQSPPLAQMWHLDDKTYQMRLSTAGDRLLTISKDQTAALWDAKTGNALGEPMRHEAAVNGAEFSPDGKWLAIVGNDGVARVWSAVTGKLHGTAKHQLSIYAVAFSPDSKWLATASADKTARVWEIATLAPPGRILLHDQEVRAVAFHPGGKKLVTASEQGIKKGKGEVIVWDLTKNAGSPLTGNPKARIRAVGYSRDGRRIFAIGSDHKAYLWDAASGKQESTPVSLHVQADHGSWFSPSLDKVIQQSESDVKLLDLPGGTGGQTLHPEAAVSLAQFSPAGRFVAVGLVNRGVRLWRTDQQTWFCSPIPPGQAVTAIRFSGNDQWLAVACEDRCVRLWDLSAAERDRIIQVPKSKGTLLSVNPDGARVLLAQTGALAVWDLDQERLVGPAIPFAPSVFAARWSPDGRMLAVASRSVVRIWEEPNEKSWAFPSLKDEEIVHLQWTSQGKELTVWGKDGKGKDHVHCWNLADKSPLSRVFSKSEQVLDSDGKRLAVWKKNNLEIQEWRGNKTQPLLKLAVVPTLFRFSPDAQFGVVSSDDSLRIWDLLRKHEPVTPVFGQGEAIRQIVYSRDGRFLASAEVSGRIRVWDAATGQVLSPPFVVASSLAEMTFRTDGEMLLAWTTDGRIHRWDLRGQTGDADALLKQVHLNAGQETHANSGSLNPVDAGTWYQLWLKSRER